MLNDKRRAPAFLRRGVHPWRLEAAPGAGRRGASGSAALGFLAHLVYLIYRFFVKSIYPFADAKTFCLRFFVDNDENLVRGASS